MIPEALRAHLFERRIVIGNGWHDDVAATDLSAQLLALDALGDDEITLRLESFGCAVDAALALIDTVDVVGVEIHAVASGRLTGAGIGVLAVCDRRGVTPHLLTELRLPEQRFSARTAADLTRSVVRAEESLERLCRRVAEDTERASTLLEGFRRGRILDSEELLTAGLADSVLRPTLGFGRPA